MASHPATRSMRSKSPFIEKAGKHVQSVVGSRFYIVNEGKIHRLLLSTRAEVEYVNLVSPSCIWVRLLNNVCDEYDLEEPYPMKKALKFDKMKVIDKKSIKEYSYYMAPRVIPADNGEEKMLYSRVRLLKIVEERKGGVLTLICYAHFIDYGYGVWLNAECLGEMPKHMYTVPWQVIPVALLGVVPSEEFETADVKWSKKQCEILKEILEKYKRFVVQPCVCKYQIIHSYENYARVELEALTESESTKPSYNSILNEFFLKSTITGEQIFIQLQWDELTDQPLYGVQDEIPIREANEAVPSLYYSFPDDKNLTKTVEEVAAEKKKEENEKLERRLLQEVEDPDELEKSKKREQMEELIKWDPKIGKCQTYTHQVANLGDYFESEEEEMFVVLDPRSKKSPYNFCGHIIPASSSISGLHDSMLKVFDQLDEWQNQLNDFYFNGSNCHRLDGEKITPEILSGNAVYGITRITDKLEQSHFVRVKVVGSTNSDNLGGDISRCFVRLLDCGGIMDMNRSTILRLHSTHAYMPPLAIQFCLSKIISPNYERLNSVNYETSEFLKDLFTIEEREQFRLLTGSGTMMKCRLIEIYEKDGIELVQNTRPVYLSPQTYHIENLRSIFSNREEKTVEQQMIESGTATYGDCPTEY